MWYVLFASICTSVGCALFVSMWASVCAPVCDAMSKRYHLPLCLALCLIGAPNSVWATSERRFGRRWGHWWAHGPRITALQDFQKYFSLRFMFIVGFWIGQNRYTRSGGLWMALLHFQFGGLYENDSNNTHYRKFRNAIKGICSSMPYFSQTQSPLSRCDFESSNFSNARTLQDVPCWCRPLRFPCLT